MQHVTETAAGPANARPLTLGVPRPEVPWLVFLGFLLLQPAFDPTTTAWSWLLVVSLTVVFVPIYGFTYRSLGARDWFYRDGSLGAMAGVAAMFALALLFPINTGAGTFGVYAMVAAARLAPRSKALWTMGAVMAGMVAITLFTALGPVPERMVALAPVLFIAPIIGLSVLYDSARKQANERLKMAHEKVEQLAAIAERERIARDLHDLLGHTLSTITLKSELAATLAGSDPATAAREMREVESLSRQTLAQVRGVVAGYRAVGLTGELANAKVALEAAHIEPDYYLAALPLSPEAESVLALALREGVTNVVRHSGATRCRITLTAGAGSVRLLVLDNGRGAAGHVEGGGLSAMRERVRALRGTVTLRTTGQLGSDGTALEATLPIETALSEGAEEHVRNVSAPAASGTP